MWKRRFVGRAGLLVLLLGAGALWSAAIVPRTLGSNDGSEEAGWTYSCGASQTVVDVGPPDGTPHDSPGCTGRLIRYYAVNPFTSAPCPGQYVAYMFRLTLPSTQTQEWKSSSICVDGLHHYSPVMSSNALRYGEMRGFGFSYGTSWQIVVYK